MPEDNNTFIEEDENERLLQQEFEEMLNDRTPPQEAMDANIKATETYAGEKRNNRADAAGEREPKDKSDVSQDKKGIQGKDIFSMYALNSDGQPNRGFFQWAAGIIRGTLFTLGIAVTTAVALVCRVLRIKPITPQNPLANLFHDIPETNKNNKESKEEKSEDEKTKSEQNTQGKDKQHEEAKAKSIKNIKDVDFGQYLATTLKAIYGKDLNYATCEYGNMKINFLKGKEPKEIIINPKTLSIVKGCGDAKEDAKILNAYCNFAITHKIQYKQVDEKYISEQLEKLNHIAEDSKKDIYFRYGNLKINIYDKGESGFKLKIKDSLIKDADKSVVFETNFNKENIKEISNKINTIIGDNIQQCANKHQELLNSNKNELLINAIEKNANEVFPGNVVNLSTNKGGNIKLEACSVQDGTVEKTFFSPKTLETTGGNKLNQKQIILSTYYKNQQNLFGKIDYPSVEQIENVIKDHAKEISNEANEKVIEYCASKVIVKGTDKPNEFEIVVSSVYDSDDKNALHTTIDKEPLSTRIEQKIKNDIDTSLNTNLEDLIVNQKLHQDKTEHARTVEFDLDDGVVNDILNKDIEKDDLEVNEDTKNKDIEEIKH